jgi:transposase
VGHCTVHHGRLIQGGLDLLALLDRQMAALDQHMGALVVPLQPQRVQLDSMPGVDRSAAREMIAAIGVDMRRFGSARRFAAWARVSPGHNERAGKRRSGRIGKGQRYVRRILVPCAWAARKTPTLLGRTCRRLEGRLGKKQAAVAIAQKMLVLGYHRLAAGTSDDEQRDAHLQPQQEDRWQRHAVKPLERLGDRVMREKRAEKPGDGHHRVPSVGTVSALSMSQKRPREEWYASAAGDISWEILPPHRHTDTDQPMSWPLHGHADWL